MAFPQGATQDQIQEMQLIEMRETAQQLVKLALTCFDHCVHDMNHRRLSNEEGQCADLCIQKFIRFNQRTMGLLSESMMRKQEKMMKDAEEEMKKQNAQIAGNSSATNEQIGENSTDSNR